MSVPDRLHACLRRASDPGAGTAFVSYAVITVVLAFPLVAAVASRLPSDPGDPVLNTWILWWNTQAVPFTQRWWSPPVFFPTPDTLAYSEHLLGLAPLSTPLYWLTGSPIVTYNLTFLATFPLSGWAAYLLARELTGRSDAAWLAGLAFAFAPYRMDQLAHLQVLASFWMPLALVGLHRHYRDGRPGGLVIFGVATAMQGLTNGYYLAFFPVLVVLWVLWFTPNEGWWRKVGRVGLTGVAASLPAVPILVRYREVHHMLGLHRSAAEIEGYSADLTGMLSGSSHLAVWDVLEWFRQPEGQLFPGLTITVVIAVAVGLVRWRPTGPEPLALRVVRLVITTAAGLFVGGLVYRLAVGPWELSPFGWKVAMTRPDQAIPQVALACVLALVVSRAGAWAYRRHSPFAFYLLAAFLLTILAMGPHPAVLGTPLMTHSPYLGLMQLPGFDGLRVPARFWMLTLVCLSAVLAIAYARMVRPDGVRRVGWLAAVTAGVLIDGWVVFPTAPAPGRSAILEQRAHGPVAELPLGWRDDDVAAMFRMAYHGQPVVNGHSGYTAPHYGALAYGLGQGHERLVHELGALGVEHIRIDRTNENAPHYESLVASMPALRLVAETYTEAVYEFADPPVRDPAVVPTGRALPVARLHTNANAHLLAFAADGNRETRWFSGPQQPGHLLHLDLGMVHPVGALVLYLGRHRMDFPRRLEIDLSVDGQTWEPAWRGTTDFEAVRAALVDPAAMPLTFPLGARPARHIRLRQVGTGDGFYWSVADLQVLAPAM